MESLFMSSDDDGEGILVWAAGEKPAFVTPQKFKQTQMMHKNEAINFLSTGGSDDCREVPRPSGFEKKKQELTPAQKERMRQNREAAIARRQSIKASADTKQYEDTNSGWRSVQKRPLMDDSSPLSRQKANSMFALRSAEPYYKKEMDEIATPAVIENSHAQFKPSKPLKATVPEPNFKKEMEEKPAHVSTENPQTQFQPSKQQLKALSAIGQGQSVFLTGSAGTGKSYILQYAIKQLRLMYGGAAVFVTASTGLAACSIGGTTVHSFAGIGLGNESKEVLADKVESRRESKARWQKASALIIDEISMIDAELFDKLDYIGRKMRKNDKPFGGIQLVVTGDFFQLPPVSPGSQQKNFAFEAACWENCFQLQIEFTQVFRQSDNEFISMLNEIRRGTCSLATIERLQACSVKRKYPDDGIIMTKLYPKKVDVGRENEQRLREISGENEMKFTAEDFGKTEYAKRLLDNTRVDKSLALKKGAQVMLLKNLDPQSGLANGARGVIVDFCDPNDPEAAQWKPLAASISPEGKWPIVRFASQESVYIIGPESWAIEEGGVEIAKRSQVPLALAWALSVHKCQGMTLDRVETDLRSAFDYGMVYVALSRVKSLEGLHLIGFDPSKIKVHPKVARFYEELNAAM